LKTAQNPVVILGMGALRRNNGAVVQASVAELCKKYKIIRSDWNGFNVLHTAAGRVGALDVGFIPQTGGKNYADIVKGTSSGAIKALYLLNADDFDVTKLSRKAFIIYQGHHGDRAASMADVILPGAAYTEKNTLLVNTEGRVQMAKQATFPPGEAREDWKIIRALSEALGKPLPYNDLSELRAVMTGKHPHLGVVDTLPHAKWVMPAAKGKMTKTPFVPAVTRQEFYLGNAVARASETMVECVNAFVLNKRLEAAE